MSVELRKVPDNWEHPTDPSGKYIPLFYKFPYDEKDVETGLEEGWLTGDPPHFNVPVMPQWTEEERTHFQMYEITTEGTPISPVMDSEETLAKWLVDNNAPVFAGKSASYDDWLRAIRHSGLIPSGVIGSNGIFISGVESLG